MTKPARYAASSAEWPGDIRAIMTPLEIEAAAELDVTIARLRIEGTKAKNRRAELYTRLRTRLRNNGRPARDMGPILELSRDLATLKRRARDLRLTRAALALDVGHRVVEREIAKALPIGEGGA